MILSTINRCEHMPRWVYYLELFGEFLHSYSVRLAFSLPWTSLVSPMQSNRIIYMIHQHSSWRKADIPLLWTHSHSSLLLWQNSSHFGIQSTLTDNVLEPFRVSPIHDPTPARPPLPEGLMMKPKEAMHVKLSYLYVVGCFYFKFLRNFHEASLLEAMGFLSSRKSTSSLPYIFFGKSYLLIIKIAHAQRFIRRKTQTQSLKALSKNRGCWWDEILPSRMKMNDSSKRPSGWRPPRDPAQLTDAAAAKNSQGVMIIVISVHY